MGEVLYYRLSMSENNDKEPPRSSRLRSTFLLRKSANSETDGPAKTLSSRLRRGKTSEKTSGLISLFKPSSKNPTSSRLLTKMRGDSSKTEPHMETPPDSDNVAPTSLEEKTLPAGLAAQALSSNKGDAGEDNYFYLEGTEHCPTILAAFDGLGGHSAGYAGENGGRIASRTVAELGKQFFIDAGGKITEEILSDFKDQVQQTLFRNAEENIRKSRFRGLASERLCTTAAITSISQPAAKGDNFGVDVAWMGDSRAYFLSPKQGLQQLTVDDALTDAESGSREAVIGGAPMQQYLSADMKDDWGFHYAHHDFTESGIVCSCTDGVFEYVPGPWEVEKYVLQTLDAASSPEEWSDKMTAKFKEVAADDVTLLVEPVGFTDFNELKKAYKDRLSKLDTLYTSADQSPEMQEKLWARYKDPYRQRIVAMEAHSLEKTVESSEETNELMVGDMRLYGEEYHDATGYEGEYDILEIKYRDEEQRS